MPHDLSSSCWCDPRVEERVGGNVIVHHEHDDRLNPATEDGGESEEE